MYLGHLPRTNSQIDPRGCKRLALFVALVLSLGAFILVSGEARAQQQQPTAPHQQPPPPQMAKQQMLPASVPPPGVEEYPAAADKGVTEPVDQAGTVAVPTAIPSLPPKPAPEKTPNTSLSGDPKKPAIEKPEPTKPDATKPGGALSEEPPARVLVRSELGPERAPVGTDPATPTPASVSAPISVPASKPPPETAPEPVAPERSDPLPASAQGEGPAAAHQPGSATLPPEEDSFSGSKPPPEKNTSADVVVAAAPIWPVLAPSSSPPPGLPVGAEEEGGDLSRVSSSLETAANAVGSAMEAARSATTSAAAEVLQALASGAAAPEPSFDAAQTTSPTKAEGDTTQPPPSQPAAPLLPPPMGDGPLYSSSGTGQAGPGSGLVVLLLGVLASGLALLVWRGGPLTLASWEVPKPTSALLLPLERPG